MNHITNSHSPYTIHQIISKLPTVTRDALPHYFSNFDLLLIKQIFNRSFPIDHPSFSSLKPSSASWNVSNLSISANSSRSTTPTPDSDEMKDPQILSI